MISPIFRTFFLEEARDNGRIFILASKLSRERSGETDIGRDLASKQFFNGAIIFNKLARNRLEALSIYRSIARFISIEGDDSKTSGSRHASSFRMDVSIERRENAISFPSPLLFRLFKSGWRWILFFSKRVEKKLK